MLVGARGWAGRWEGEPLWAAEGVRGRGVGVWSGWRELERCTAETRVALFPGTSCVEVNDGRERSGLSRNGK